MMNFETGWANLTIGDRVQVSYGAEPIAAPDSVEFRAWRSANFIGTLSANVYGPPRGLSFDLDPDANGNLITFTIEEGVGHSLMPITWNEPLAYAQANKWAEIKNARDKALYGGCMTPLGRMDTDAESQGKVNGAATMAQLIGPAFSVAWTMADNSVVVHNQQAMFNAALAVGMFVAQCHAQGQQLRSQIDAATTPDELSSIRWTN